MTAWGIAEEERGASIAGDIGPNASFAQSATDATIVVSADWMRRNVKRANISERRVRSVLAAEGASFPAANARSAPTATEVIQRSREGMLMKVVNAIEEPSSCGGSSQTLIAEVYYVSLSLSCSGSCSMWTPRCRMTSVLLPILVYGQNSL